MIHIDQAVIVEGKYDKIKLSAIIDAIIIPTHGFSVFKDKEKVELIRYLAKNKGIIILTDSDTAGFKIRNYIKGCISDGNIINVYIPDIFGKEKRKLAPSKEGKLGVEGIDKDVIINAFNKAGVGLTQNYSADKEEISRVDLFETGLMGRDNSCIMRKLLLKKMGLPELLSTTSMLQIINSTMSRDDFFALVNSKDL